MRYRVRNLTRNTLLADRATVADTFGSRFKGLLGVSEYPLGCGLHLVPCNSIHMFFMKIALDVLFLDRELTVVEALEAFPPWRVSRIYPSARSVLELPVGALRGSQTQPGDRLIFEPA